MGAPSVAVPMGERLNGSPAGGFEGDVVGVGDVGSLAAMGVGALGAIGIWLAGVMADGLAELVGSLAAADP